MSHDYSMESSGYLHCNNGVGLVVKTLTHWVRDAGSNPAPYLLRCIVSSGPAEHSGALEKVLIGGRISWEFSVRSQHTIRKIS